MLLSLNKIMVKEFCLNTIQNFTRNYAVDDPLAAAGRLISLLKQNEGRVEVWHGTRSYVPEFTYSV